MPIDKEKLLSHSSLNAFFHEFIGNLRSFYNSSGEQQQIEGKIEEYFGVAPRDLFSGKVSPQDFFANFDQIIDGDQWLANTLLTIFNCLAVYRYEMSLAAATDPEITVGDLFDNPEGYRDQIRRIYDLGFLNGRLVSEHFIRYEIEPWAEKGLVADEAQKTRNQKSGASASKKRHERIYALLCQMEKLVSLNPAFNRLEPETFAGLAIEDATKENPKLWAQGSGRRGEYLDELKTDIRYRDRYRKLRSRTA